MGGGTNAAWGAGGWHTGGMAGALPGCDPAGIWQSRRSAWPWTDAVNVGPSRRHEEEMR